MHVCVCICTTCERCLMMVLEVVECIGMNLVVVLIFYSFMMFLLVLSYIKCL